MIPKPKPLQLVMYRDVLCAWCYVAEHRLAALCAELGPLVRLSHRPFALRLHDVAPTPRETAAATRELSRARREPEAQNLQPGLWTGGDPPRSSLPPLLALAAARAQGPEAHRALAQALRTAALEQGINVTRSDVLYELAGRAGLRMGRFAASFTAPATRHFVLGIHANASARGISRVPTLVVAGRWKIEGLREPSEYKDLILGCFSRAAKGRDGGDDDQRVH